VCWDSQPVTTTADEAIAASNNEGQTAMKEAMEFLRDELAASPQAAQDIKKAATSAGFSWATIRRAKDELKIRSVKGGLQDGWFWELPKVFNEGGQGAHS
jgi:putative DNA primase/helicase